MELALLSLRTVAGQLSVWSPLDVDDLLCGWVSGIESGMVLYTWWWFLWLFLWWW